MFVCEPIDLMLTDNARSFHQRVFSLRPKQTTKLTTFWVAVLKSSVKLSSNITEEDFLWIKCHGEIKASVIRSQYEQKNPSDGKIKLKLGTLVGDDDTMRALDHYKDQLVVFEVVKASDASSSHLTRGRSPLRPTINQLRAPPPDHHTGPALKDHSSQISGVKFKNMFPKVEGHDENQNLLPGMQPLAAPQSAPAAISPASMFPKAEPFSPSSIVTPRPDWATSNGFSFYETKTREKMTLKWSHLNDGKPNQIFTILSLLILYGSIAQIYNLLLDSWLKLSSIERQHYEDAAKQDSASRDVKLEPIKAELTVKDLLPVDQFPTGPSGSQDSPKETFQLQKLLTEATPELLETSVEEGVRLLDNLKGQMLTDSATSSDASQWVQQIGIHDCQLSIYLADPH